MKKCLCFILICMLLVPLGASPAWAQEELLPAAQNVLLVDRDTGAVLFEQNADERCAPASLTKIMTVLLAVEAIEAGEATRTEYVTAGEDCRAGLDSDSSSVGIQAGEKLRMEELLYCAMLASANESCNVIACRLAGSVEAFAARMNERASELGCTDTHFVNPNGLSADGHYTTARDLMRIAREAMDHELFAEICAATEYTVPPTNMSGKRELENTNALLHADGMYGAGYTYEGAHGVKTGYTSEAGYCLVSAVERDGVRLMAVVLGCAGSADTGYGSFSETIRLYDWAFENYESKTVLDPMQCVWTGDVAYGRGEVALYPAEAAELFLPVDADAPEIEVTLDPSRLTAPIAVGESLGAATVHYGDAVLSVALVTKAPVERDGLRWGVHCLVTSVWFWLAVVAVGLVTIYVVTQQAARRKRRRRRAQRLAAQGAATSSRRTEK